MKVLLGVSAPLILLLLAAGLPLMVLGGAAQVGGCASGPSVTVDLDSIPTSAIGQGRWSGQRLVHAAIIINAGAQLDVGLRGQQIGVMTAMGESTLDNLGYGDVAGPDSRGLFQQRDNGAWGTLADRMDPHIASTNFFRALLEVPGWQDLPMTIAAHRTQINADPYHYQPFEGDARLVVAALANARVTQVTTSQAGIGCTITPGQITADGWTHPIVDARLSSPFGPRVRPCTGCSNFHLGQDFGAPTGSAVYAASAGTIVQAGFSNCGGQTVRIAHPGVQTRYLHLSRIDVAVGQAVPAGLQIGLSGNTGECTTGPHLHFEVKPDGSGPIDPVAFLRTVGVVYA